MITIAISSTILILFFPLKLRFLRSADPGRVRNNYLKAANRAIFSFFRYHTSVKCLSVLGNWKVYCALVVGSKPSWADFSKGEFIERISEEFTRVRKVTLGIDQGLRQF